MSRSLPGAPATHGKPIVGAVGNGIRSRRLRSLPGAPNLLQTADSMTKAKLLSVSMGNVLILVIVSMAIGALFGLASGKVGSALTAKGAA